MAEAGDQVQYYQNSKGRYDITGYRSCVLIIIDDVDENQGQNNEHARKCDLVRNFFQQCTNYEVHSVRLPPNSTIHDWNIFWDNELAGKGQGDLIIPYYHGKAGGNGRDWSWAFTGYPRGPVNAYSLIERINGTQVDCMMILDCYLPTRFRKRWKRSTLMEGNTELFNNGEALQNLNGNIVVTKGEFTTAMDRNMRKYLAAVVAERDVEEEERRHRAPRSILEIMKFNKLIDSNPRRIWINRTKKPHIIEVKRIKVLPWEVRESGRIEFHSVKIQPLDERYQQYGPIPLDIGGEQDKGEGRDDEGFNEPDGEDDGDLFVR